MAFKIAILVKQVPDHEAIIQIVSERELSIENRYVCSFFDEIAVEAALNIQKKFPDAELVALSTGGKKATDALRRAVALGIDQVEQIGDESIEKAESNLIACALAARLKTLQPHLILCGKQAGDDDMASIGPMVAEYLKIPHASAVISLEIDAAANKAKIGREVEGEIWHLESGLPLLITAEKGLAEPHVPVVTRVMKAMKAKIQNIQLTELTVQGYEQQSRTRRLRYMMPASRPPVTMMQQPFPQNIEELISHLKEKGVLS